MNTFSFRAECLIDVYRFSNLIRTSRAVTDVSTWQHDAVLPDVDVEMRVNASLDELRKMLSQLSDSHVMLETLRDVPLAQNSLKREDFSMPSHVGAATPLPGSDQIERPRNRA